MGRPTRALGRVRPRRRWLIAVAAVVAAAAAVWLALQPAGRPRSLASSPCDLVAAPSGSDANPGTLARPYRSAAALVAHLPAGHAGCLRAGTYVGDVTVRRGGSTAHPLTLRSFPGELARLIGRLVIADGADDVLVEDLALDGNARVDRLPSPTVNADHVSFERLDVTNDRTDNICFLLGDPEYGRADDAVIRDSRIHDCGTSAQDHGIYVGASTGSLILGNAIYRNSGRGIQLYPDAQRTTIVGNLMLDNGIGVMFSGANGIAASDNLVAGNVIVDSRDYNINDYYPSGTPPGRGNVVRSNCIHGGRPGDIIAPRIGFSATANVFVDPGPVDPLRPPGFGLAKHSSCGRLLGVGGQ